MSWVKKGSQTLAAITTLTFNNDYEGWFRDKEVNFKKVSSAQVEIFCEYPSCYDTKLDATFSDHSVPVSVRIHMVCSKCRLSG